MSKVQAEIKRDASSKALEYIKNALERERSKQRLKVNKDNEHL